MLIEEGGSTTNEHAQATYNHAGTVYDFYNSVFGRDSYDGAGAEINSTIHYLEDYEHSFFDPAREWFVYGDGNGETIFYLGDSLDMVTHEMTHGVTNEDPGFEYLNESGALSEAYSDIFAAVIDVYKNGLCNGKICPTTWRIAEDAYSPWDSSIALRYMNDPTEDGVSRDNYPDRYTGTDDKGGVHWNSGIINLAFYLLSQGGAHPDPSVSTINVSGIGINKARNIFYEALNFLQSSDKFAMWLLREEAEDRAQAIYGSSAKASVTQAFDAVLVPGPNIVPVPPDTITAQSTFCYGWHSTSWEAAAAASTYEVRFSVDQNFAAGPLMYSGSSTGVFLFDIPESGFLGVKACNASGCSSYESSEYLTWWPSCE